MIRSGRRLHRSAAKKIPIRTVGGNPQSNRIFAHRIEALPGNRNDQSAIAHAVRRCCARIEFGYSSRSFALTVNFKCFPSFNVIRAEFWPKKLAIHSTASSELSKFFAASPQDQSFRFQSNRVQSCSGSRVRKRMNSGTQLTTQSKTDKVVTI